MRIGSAILAMAAAAAMPAFAAERADDVVRVDYKDLDLGTTAGRSELERRLERAARHVCGIGEASTGTRLPSEASRRCLREVRAGLDRQFAALIPGKPQG